MNSDPPHPDVAIIGAGPAGLAAAEALRSRDRTVQLFDKGRGPGGRLSTRRRGETRFDHGAYVLDFPQDRVRPILDRWIEQGVVKRWNPIESGSGTRTPHWVGAPAMNAVVRVEAEASNVSFATRITALERVEGGWWLLDQAGGVAGRAAQVIIAIPAPQARELLAGTGFRHLPALDTVAFDPVWAFMFEGPDRRELGFDLLRHPTPAISHAEAQSSKPDRRTDRSWVAHATPEWSRVNLEADPDTVARRLAEELGPVLGMAITPPWSAHRWRYARVRTAVGVESLVDEALGLTACGDWCLGPTVEDALLSGLAAGRRAACWSPLAG
ncbi:MAG: NAD(P)-binding protein [Planctomycetota bacterium]|nr:NAD(P)-binding protein [Planctomycetota bacterium]